MTDYKKLYENLVQFILCHKEAPTDNQSTWSENEEQAWTGGWEAFGEKLVKRIQEDIVYFEETKGE